MATTEKGYGEEWAKRVYDENLAVDHFLGLRPNFKNQRQPGESKGKGVWPPPPPRGFWEKGKGGGLILKCQS